MKRATASRVGIICLAVSVLLITSCGKKESSGFVPATLPSDGGGGSTTPIPGKGFGVSIPSTYEGSSYLHLFNSPTAPCEVPTNATTPQEIQCLVSVPELDLYSYGLPLTINYPAGMCKFSGQLPYYYYAFEPGTGPSSFTMAVTVDGETREVTACGGGATLNAGLNRCDFAFSEGSVNKEGNPTCAYDHTAAQGPNCCQGSYAITMTETTITRDTNGVETNRVSLPKLITGNYGGKHANCLAGPGLAGSVAIDGYPVYSIGKVPKNGNKDSYSTPVPIAAHSGKHVNFAAANFFGWDDYVIGDHENSPRPRSLSPVEDRSHDFLSDTSESYMFDCLNEAKELKHRIHVYIVEWDTIENYNVYVQNGDTSVSPNALDTDQDGIHCAVGEALPGSGKCNDYGDWNFQDVLTKFAGEVFDM